MSDETLGMTEAELADYYDQTHEASEFDESAAISWFRGFDKEGP